MLTTMLFAVFAVSLVLAAAEVAVLALHVGRGARLATFTPRVSVLKPLCGRDAGLEQNLASFGAQEYPSYEILLGVERLTDPAYPVAKAFEAANPGRVRVVLQEGVVGLNPKVNQLATLVRHAKHDVLVISDSNVRVPRTYLGDLVAPLADSSVGMVTSPFFGLPGNNLGGRLDTAQLATFVAPGTLGLTTLLRQSIFVGKSMAFRRADLEAVGGFAAFGELLNEDQALGEAMVRLGKKGATARVPIANVTDCTVRQFVDRYVRWGQIHKKMTGPAFLAELITASYLPGALLFALAGAAGNVPLAMLALVGVGLRFLTDAVAHRALEGKWASASMLALGPVREALTALALTRALLTDRVSWRGKTFWLGPNAVLSSTPPRALGGELGVGA